jgi:chromosome partitioning protein
VPGGQVISVLNMKGGVGKTTITANVMRVLYLFLGKKVLLIDLDPQFNLTQVVMARDEYDVLKTAGHTIFSAMEPPSRVGLFDVAITTHAPPQPSSLVKVLKRTKNGANYLHLIPGNFDLVKYSLISDHDKLAHVRQRFIQFVAAARADYDLVIIDCNPSSSFITLCALHACTRLLVPIRPARYSILGLELLNAFVEDIPTIDDKPALTVVLNGIPRQHYDQSVERQLRAHVSFGKSVLVNRLHISSLLSARLDYIGFAIDKRAPYRKRLLTDILKIVYELKVVWGL